MEKGGQDLKQAGGEAYCYAKLPKAGLGNMLLVWARALVFAHLNGLPQLTPNWTHIKIGPILRRERSSRLYSGYFKDLSHVNYAKQVFILRTYKHVAEPAIGSLPDGQISRKLFVFKEIPHWADYFKDIKGYRDLIKSNLISMLSEQSRMSLSKLKPPVIGVHIRRADFRDLRAGEDFSKVGLVRTPLSYFKNMINSIREIHGNCLPVTVFSDGHDSELGEVLDLPDVSRCPPNTDIVDLLLLSKSKLIITSAGSTFSYWSAFLADAPVVLHWEHVHQSIRPEEINRTWFEGGVSGMTDAWPLLLKQNIHSIACRGE